MRAAALGLVISLGAGAGVLAQDPSATPPAQQADSSQPLTLRTVRGRVVRPGKTGMITIGDTWVTLHRVAPNNSGPVDSVQTDARGRYSMRYMPVREALYFASSSYGGVAYFTAPLPAGDAGADAGEITVFDTTSATLPIHIRGRHVVVSSSTANGARTVVEVFELSNDTTVTAVAGPRNHATWSTGVPPNATNFEVGQSDIGADAVQFRDGRVLTYASLSPGIRQIAFSYAIPADAFPLALPIADPVTVLEVLIEDAGGTASGGKLSERPSVPLEGRTFRRFMAQDVKSGTSITIDAGQPTGGSSDSSRIVFITVLTAATVMVLALAFALTRRRGVRVVARAIEPEDAAHLARDIAELDDVFERSTSPSDAERDAYRERRDALKSRLAAALAKEQAPV
jgi:hypothetical protein